MLTKRKLDCSGYGAKNKYMKMENGRAITPSVPTSRVKVFIRVRPLTEKEIARSEKKTVNFIDKKSIIFDPVEQSDDFYFRGVVQKRRDVSSKVKKNMIFEFDQVFNEHSSNAEVFEITTKSLVSSLFEGFNCSVFAYGATGTGKTHTMIGTTDNPGITHLTIIQLLQEINSWRKNYTITIGASYLEVYNEIVRDLLQPDQKELMLREESGITVIVGLKIISISENDNLLALLEEGNKHRSQHPTDSNAESSRSHAVFQLHIKMKSKLTNEVKISKLSMIDLAGSEKGSATGCSGVRFKEGSNINRSLLALGNCINALADGLRHVPFRDSKLTRILKDSLGGNCQTLMIANISPTFKSYDDTYNTLKYAVRAKSISTTLRKNIMPQNMALPQYKKLVQELQQKNCELKDKLARYQLENPELMEWMLSCEEIMKARKKLHAEMMALESQKKLTEWRINRKRKAHVLYNPENHTDQPGNMIRLESSMVQLRARCEGVTKRMDELIPLMNGNDTEREKLIERINSIKEKELYKAIVTRFDLEVSDAEKTIQVQHCEKMIRLHSKQEESYKICVDEISPVLNEFFCLLKAHGHITKNLTQKYERAIGSVSGLKNVTWNSALADEESDVEEFDEVHLRSSYYSKLNPPGISASPIDVATKKELEESENYIRKCEFTYQPTPLRNINSSTQMSKKLKFSEKKLKLNPDFVTTNKENINYLVNLNVKKTPTFGSSNKSNCDYSRITPKKPGQFKLKNSLLHNRK